VLLAAGLLSSLVLAGCASGGGQGGSGTTDAGGAASAANGGDDTGAGATTPPEAGDTGGANSPDFSTNRAPATPEGNDIVIPLTEVTEEARFYPTTSNGVPMEVLAVLASDGTVRTALNTCQVCYDSGYGYYVQEDDELVCQNCGNRFAVDDVAVEQGGCNPVPITEDLREVSGEEIVIPAALIAQAEEFFLKWRR
jgi:hypothetical protein